MSTIRAACRWLFGSGIAASRLYPSEVLASRVCPPGPPVDPEIDKFRVYLEAKDPVHRMVDMIWNDPEAREDLMALVRRHRYLFPDPDGVD